MTQHRSLTPPGWPRGKGHSHGVVAEGQMVFVSGQVGWDENERFAGSDFTAQLRQTLLNIKAILAEAGAGPEHVVRMTWFVVDKQEYLSHLKDVGTAYREVMGKNYPAMAVVEVKGLVDDRARLEIETTAVVPKSHPVGAALCSSYSTGRISRADRYFESVARRLSIPRSNVARHPPFRMARSRSAASVTCR